MKTIAFAALLLVATATASDFVQRHAAEDALINGVETVKEAILERGLDPVALDNGQVEYVFIDTSIFGVSAYVEDFSLVGLSNIVVRYVNYAPMSRELSFYVEFPQVMVTIGDAGTTISALGNEVQGEASGLFAINGLGAEGRVRVNYGPGPTTIQAIYVNGRLRSIDSNLTLKLWTFDVSTFVNQWFRALPENLRMYDDLIGMGLARIIEFFVNRRLD